MSITTEPVVIEGIDTEGVVVCENPRCERQAEWIVSSICPHCGPHHALGCDPCLRAELVVSALSSFLQCAHCKATVPSDQIEITYRRFG